MASKIKRLHNNENERKINIEDKKVKQAILTNFFQNNTVKKDPGLIVAKGLSESSIPVHNNLTPQKPHSVVNETNTSQKPSVVTGVTSSSSLTPQRAVMMPGFRIQDYLRDPKWRSLLSKEFEKKYFTEINQFLEKEYAKGIVRPPKELVFNAYNSTNIDNIKVVIIGQDPYHNDNQAHGLSFSVPEGIPAPPSLKNIYIELKNDIPEFQRSAKNSGCLQKWCDEGVFLLNAILTVQAHQASSHSKIGWEAFTDETIRVISRHNSGCAFLLWGNFAKKKETLIDTKKHKVIKSGHPSPFSVNLFFNSKCFSQANSFLKSIGKKPVNWSLN